MMEKTTYDVWEALYPDDEELAAVLRMKSSLGLAMLKAAQAEPTDDPQLQGMMNDPQGHSLEALVRGATRLGLWVRVISPNLRNPESVEIPDD